jgi:hypothetical protein
MAFLDRYEQNWQRGLDLPRVAECRNWLDSIEARPQMGILLGPHKSGKTFISEDICFGNISKASISLPPNLTPAEFTSCWLQKPIMASRP